METPEAEIGHDAPVSFEEPQPPMADPPSPQGTNVPVPESADPLLDLVPLLDPLPPLDPPLLPPLLLDAAPELLLELLAPASRPEPPLPELPVLEVPPPEPPPLDAPPVEASPQSTGEGGGGPHDAASTNPMRPIAPTRVPKRARLVSKNIFSTRITFAA